MMMINPDVIKGNFGAPRNPPYTGTGTDTVTSKVDSMSDLERGWSGWTGENTTGEVEQTPQLAAMSVIESYVARVPEMNVKFGSNVDDGENGLTMSLRTEESATLQDNDQLVAQYQAELAGLIKGIQESLSNAGLKNIKIEEVVVQVTPGMYRSAGSGAAMRQAMFTIEGQYKLYF